MSKDNEKLLAARGLDLETDSFPTQASSPSPQASRLQPLAASRQPQQLSTQHSGLRTQEFLETLAWSDPVSRRHFLRLMGASLGLAGLSACVTDRPREEIVPYVQAPEKIVPGKPLFFATAMPLSGFASGLLVENHMGRPTKVEGNPQHPASLGATDVFAQASVLTLYDPDRSQTLTYLGAIQSWNGFVDAMRTALAAQRAEQGAGLRILTETVTSPTLASQLRALLQEFPAAKWHQYEPVGRDNTRAGAQLAFGEPVHTVYDFAKAEVILALDADFLTCTAGSVRYAHDFAVNRRVEGEKSTMNRLYAVEPTPSLTGTIADHHLPLRASDIAPFARTLAAALGIAGVQSPESAGAGVPQDWVKAVVKDLQQHRGSNLVIVGEQQPPIVHALAHAMNDILGNVGATVIYTDPIEANPVDHVASLRELVADMAEGRVEFLVILGGNPVYTAPVDVSFAEHLTKVPLRVHLSLYDDETSEFCHWQVPEAHYLESWGDARAYNGADSIMQPLIAPLYEGKSAYEVLAVLLNQPTRSSYDIIRAHWQEQYAAGAVTTMEPNFEIFWRAALHDGLIAGTASPAKRVALKTDWMHQPSASPPSHSTPDQPSLEIIFRPDPAVYDGRFTNNGWLQELPKPLTKLTWGNAAVVSPTTAQRLGLSLRVGDTGGEHGTVNAEVVRLEYRGQVVHAPVWILAGHADDCVTVHLGYGRPRAGQVGSAVGFNAYTLRTSDALWFGQGLTLQKTDEWHPLACTQFHHHMEGRELLRSATLEEYRQRPDFAHSGPEFPRTTLYPEYEYPGYAWGMTINLSACIGCNACVVACQAENNIPVVGKTEVMRAREMHWIRIDVYHKGESANPETYCQPVPCMQCEKAPCELVCPVNATVHSAEGLNDMIYNRCVGTRYCSNNCPYKVRRFNFFQYADWDTPSLRLLRNPEVTTRSRGVMEKCTYCVQRINRARIGAEKENRRVRDGEVVTACQAACPTQAITFGDINDPQSRVSQLKAEPRNYGLLAELNTQPRTTYLAALRNPNPEIEHK